MERFKVQKIILNEHKNREEKAYLKKCQNLELISLR